MLYRRLLSGVFLMVLTGLALPAQAQDFGESDTERDAASAAGEANALGSGTPSLSFAFPAGTNPYADGTAGVWYMVSDNINLGFNLGFGIESTRTFQNFGEDDQTSTQRTGFDLLLAPAMRYYLGTESRVAPYILGQINFHKFFDGDNDTTADPEDDNFNPALQPELSLIGGFGLEWFPIERFSIGGHVGLGFDIIRQDSVSGGTLTRNGLRIGTFTSVLTANIYL